jgi:hypothetical protein
MKSSLLKRLEKLEKEWCFVTWYLQDRFLGTLNIEELDEYARDGKLPEPVPNRPSPLDRLDRNSLRKRWEENERRYEGRTREDMQRFVEKGLWPEQFGKLHYSKKDGGLYVEWQIEAEQKSEATAQDKGDDD